MQRCGLSLSVLQHLVIIILHHLGSLISQFKEFLLHRRCHPLKVRSMFCHRLPAISLISLRYGHSIGELSSRNYWALASFSRVRLKSASHCSTIVKHSRVIWMDRAVFWLCVLRTFGCLRKCEYLPLKLRSKLWDIEKFRHGTSTVASIVSSLLSTIFASLSNWALLLVYRVGQKTGPQTHDHKYVKSWPIKKIHWKIP